MISGLLAGSLTSTPAFSATKEAVAAQYQDAVTVGYGIAYLFGVIGVVLFVQLMPRVVHADLDEGAQKNYTRRDRRRRQIQGKAARI